MTAANRSLPHRRAFLRAVAASAAVGGCLSAIGAERPEEDELPITGRSDRELRCIDRMMSAFVTLHDIPGAAMAVTRNGRLVYARGFGYADRDAKEPVRPDTLFRIASVSKPITSAAVLQLVGQGKLALTDHAFDVLDLKPHLRWWDRFDSRLKDITMQQLLQHTGGWDREVSYDPIGRFLKIAKSLGVKPPPTPEHVIRYMLGQKLDFAPGQRFAYSNLGYCILGRIIEKVTGRSYEDQVRRELLAPLGITRMRLGKTLREDRAPGESCYYDALNRTAPAIMGPQLGEPVPVPYGAWCLETMDAHGGWIASAIDLVRFATALDVPERCKVLNPKSVRTLFDRPPGSAGYDEKGRPKAAYHGCGWNVRPQDAGGKRNTWHGGALSGTAAWLVRRSDGLNWAILFNAMESPTGEYLGTSIDFFGHHAVNKVKTWPEIDLFEKAAPK